MKELTVEADTEQLETVTAFLNEQLEAKSCTMKVQTQLEIVVEEIFANIANYAYPSKKGQVTIRIIVEEETLSMVITFIDSGIPYDPLKKEDPDITLSAEEREIGGLGVFLCKKLVDDMHYEYKDGKNILTIQKKLEVQ